MLNSCTNPKIAGFSNCMALRIFSLSSREKAGVRAALGFEEDRKCGRILVMWIKHNDAWLPIGQVGFSAPFEKTMKDCCNRT